LGRPLGAALAAGNLSAVSIKATQNVGLAIGFLVVLGISVLAFQHAQGDAPVRDIPTSGASPGLSPTETEPPSLVVIGDSFAVTNSNNKVPAWPQQIDANSPWYVNVLAVDRSGYLTPGAGSDFSERVRGVISTYPTIDYVVLAGGREDMADSSTKQIVRAARRDITTIHRGLPAGVIVLSPFVTAPAEAETKQDRQEAEELTAAFQKMCKRADVPFIDVTGMVSAEDLGPDGTHLTDKGQTALARKLENALSDYVKS
jgi:hypothetical protein